MSCQQHLSPDLQKQLAKELPEVMQGFMQMHSAAIKDGALSAKQKELIAVGIAVAVRCSYCIAHHVKQARALGAGRQEILEAAGVAILMGGGPAVAYSTEVLKLLGGE